MIIIKIIILYFIQIRHTDDFPSTDSRLVYIRSVVPVGQSSSKMIRIWSGSGLKNLLRILDHCEIGQNNIMPSHYDVT